MTKRVRMVKKILAVTDQNELRNILRETFDVPGEPYVLMEASTGEEGIEAAVTEQPDVVLMDIGLHSVSGVDAARKIHSSVPKCKIIMLTMYLCDSNPIGI